MTQWSFVFDAAVDTFLEAEGSVTNRELYDQVQQRLGLSDQEVAATAPVGSDGAAHNTYHRQVRWVIQSLKHGDLVKQVRRGEWEMLGSKKRALKAIKTGRSVLAYSTDLGICIWTRDQAIFNDFITEDIHLVLSSPPYPIKRGRLYGKVAITDYIDFICKALEPIIPRMALGANIALNMSNDIFEPGLPARSTYLERLVIALEDRFGLSLMDRHIWESNKPPGPTRYASILRNHVNVGYEPVYVFCNSPKHTFADNRRVLRPHTERQIRLMEGGGTKRRTESHDGAHCQRVGSYSNVTEGSIPRNVLRIGNKCVESRAVKAYAEELGLPSHGAKMPLALADFFVRFLTRPDQLVVDPFAGSGTTGQAAQRAGRRFIMCEMALEYIQQSFRRFVDFPNCWFNPELNKV